MNGLLNYCINSHIGIKSLEKSAQMVIASLVSINSFEKNFKTFYVTLLADFSMSLFLHNYSAFLCLERIRRKP